MSDIVPAKRDDLSSGVIEPRPPWPGWMISVLITAHVLAGVALVFFSVHFGMAVLSLISLVLCQCSLVGLWGGIGITPPVVRMVGMLAAAVYFGTELGWRGTFGVGYALYAMVLFATCSMAAIIWIVRSFAPTLSRIDEPGVARDGHQFSIRSLILLTILIASLLTLGRRLAPFIEDSDYPTIIMVIGICSVPVALTSIWAMLGRGNPLVRCYLVFAFALVLLAGAGWIRVGQTVAGLIGIMLLHAFFLLGSLFVVRRCGYRLLAMPVAEAGS